MLTLPGRHSLAIRPRHPGRDRECVLILRYLVGSTGRCQGMSCHARYGAVPSRDGAWWRTALSNPELVSGRQVDKGARQRF
jgi:hypothetical protein